MNLRAVQHKSKMEIAYDALKDAIVSGKWKIGERKNAKEIAKTLKISTTPVMEACKLLEMEGLLRVLPQVGIELPKLSSQGQEEIFLIRGALSGIATAHSCRYLTKKDLNNLIAISRSLDLCCKAGNSDEFFNLNREFHHLIYMNCKLPHIIMLLERYWNNGNSYAKYFREIPGVLTLVTKNHHKILQALKDRNEVEAKDAAEKNCFEFGSALANYLIKINYFELHKDNNYD